MGLHKFHNKPVTDIFTPKDTSINRRQCQRVVPMRVLALGLGRTGTASLREALKQLGVDDCYHMMSASVENPPDCLMWSDAFAAKYDGRGAFGREDWDQLFGHCQGVCDWPAVAFAPELIKAYPDALVILTNRDVDSWFASTMKTVHWRANDPELRMLSKFDWASRFYYPMLSKFWTAFWEGDFEKNGKRRYQEYYNEVRSLVPPERLLEYKVGEGWKRLCDALNVPIPATPFPRTNDTDGFVSRCRSRNRKQMLNVLVRWMVNGVLFATTFLALFLLLAQCLKGIDWIYCAHSGVDRDV